MKVYVASSWRNELQPEVVAALRAEGHEVYDFRHPEPGNDGFAWSAIDPAWQGWDADTFHDALHHEIAAGGFALDMTALRECDACVLVMPCGRSAHLELGYAVGAGKLTRILLPRGVAFEPELMWLMVGTLSHSVRELCDSLAICQECTPPNGCDCEAQCSAGLGWGPAVTRDAPIGKARP